MSNRIEKPVFHKDEYREQTEEEVKETLRLALQEAKDRLTPIELVQEIMKLLDLQEVKRQLSNLRKGTYDH